MDIRVMNNDWYDGLRFAIFRNGRTEIATNISFREYKPLELVDNQKEQPMQMTNEEAQCLMNDLWQCGVRPTNGEGSVGELKATQHHLKDMQKIVFDYISNTD